MYARTYVDTYIRIACSTPIGFVSNGCEPRSGDTGSSILRGERNRRNCRFRSAHPGNLLFNLVTLGCSAVAFSLNRFERIPAHLPQCEIYFPSPAAVERRTRAVDEASPSFRPFTVRTVHTVVQLIN